LREALLAFLKTWACQKIPILKEFEVEGEAADEEIAVKVREC